MKSTHLIAGLALLGSAAHAQAQAPMIATPPQVVMAVTPGPSGSSLGVRIRDVSASDASRLQTESGAVVDQVLDNTPAKTAGLQASDVIVEFDGERVRSTRQLSRLVQETPPGRSVKIVVLRDGRTMNLSIAPDRERGTAAERWEPGIRVEPRMRVEPGVRVDSPRFRAQIGPFEWDGLRSRARLGATVEEVTPQLAEYFGAKQGVLVSSVNDNSPAARAGLRAGDVITAVNGQPIDARADLVEALSDAKDGDELALFDRPQQARVIPQSQSRAARESSRFAELIRPYSLQPGPQ